MAEKVRQSVNGGGRHRGGGMREKVCRRKADRKSEKSDMAESFCCLSLSPSRLSLQMEVNVKQSLLLVSGGINSLEWDSAVREVNACLSVCSTFPLL